MFSDGDSSNGINSFNQLSGYGFVNQAAVSSAMAAGQNIDWAQLAQQWIQMRDNSPAKQMTDGNEGSSGGQSKDGSLHLDQKNWSLCGGKVSESNFRTSNFEEKGEADMDMDDEEQILDKSSQGLNNEFSVTSSSVHNSLNQPWFYGEETSRTSYSQWNPWSNRDGLTESLPNKNIRPANSTAHIPSLLNITVPNPNKIRAIPDISTQSENSTHVMDAAKKKGLPAWIREGLEKMEREKQKQLEKDLQTNENMCLPDNNGSTKNILPTPLNSKSDSVFATLGDDSADNDNLAIMNANNEKNVNLQRHNEEQDGNYTCNSLKCRTYEQKLADLMTIVRQGLTELLLDVTNEEISKVAHETIKIYKSKASSAQVIRKSALSTLTSKLGLAAYVDSSSDDNCDEDERDSAKTENGQSESDQDSEEEIRNIIRQKRRSFIKISEEIEDRLASAATREEEKLKYFLRLEKDEEERGHNRKKLERSLLKDPLTSANIGNKVYKGYEKDFGEITETKIQHINGKKQRDQSSRRERTTRFSDNKEKYVALPNASTFLTKMNTSATTVNTGNSNITPAVVPSSNSQRQTGISDINGLLPNYASLGMANVLNAADAALEKVLKGRITSASPEKHSRRHDRNHRDFVPVKKKRRTGDGKNSRSRSKSSFSSTSATSASTDTNSSTSRSSRHSKYSYRSASKHKSHSSVDTKYEKTHKDYHYRDDRKYSSSSSSYKKRDRKSTKHRYHPDESSGSEEDYRRRNKYDSHYKRNSQSRIYTPSRRDVDRERSRSRSRSSYSSSSNRRQ